MDPYALAKTIIERRLQTTSQDAVLASLNRDLNILIRRGDDNGVVGLAMFFRVLREKGANVEEPTNKINTYMNSKVVKSGRRRRTRRRQTKNEL